MPLLLTTFYYKHYAGKVVFDDSILGETGEEDPFDYDQYIKGLLNHIHTHTQTLITKTLFNS